MQYIYIYIHYIIYIYRIESCGSRNPRRNQPPKPTLQAASVCETKGMKLARWADLCPKGRGKTSSVPQLGSLEQMENGS